VPTCGLKFKLDENLSPPLPALLPSRATRRTRSSSNPSAAKATRPSSRSVRASLARCHTRSGLANIQQYPPAQYAGIVVLRLASQSHREVEDALGSALKLLEQEPLAGRLWIVEPGRIRIHE